MKKVLNALFVVFLLSSCEQKEQPILTHKYSEGYARIHTSDSTWWNIRGDLEIQVFNNYVIIVRRQEDSSDDEMWIVPREKFGVFGEEI